MPEIKADWKAILALGGVALVFYFLAKREASAAVKGVEKAVNITSPSNIAYQTANAILAPKGQSIGSEIYNITHPGS